MKNAKSWSSDCKLSKNSRGGGLTSAEVRRRAHQASRDTPPPVHTSSDVWNWHYSCVIKDHRYNCEICQPPGGRTWDEQQGWQTRWPNVEHSKFEGHVTPKEDEYKKPLQLNLDNVLEYHNIISLLITCISPEEIDFEIGHFRNFRTGFNSKPTIYNTL